MFFETSEGAPPPERVDSRLMEYQNMGILRKLQGLLVDRPMRYTAAEKPQMGEMLLGRTRACTHPVVADMDFGHTAPQFTLPLRCRARIDAERQRFEVPDAAVE